MKFSLFIVSVLFNFNLESQVYIVNSEDDIDDGDCNALHCSLREAINASEKDSVPSTILFNISGAGIHTIVPNFPFPTITKPDLTIIGESQSGGPGAILIDFKYKEFQGICFWQIFGQQFKISGINFKNFIFSEIHDEMFRFGSVAMNADNSSIKNCSFINDSIQINNAYNSLINIENADKIVISNCNFGTDHSRSFIANLDRAIGAGQFYPKKVTIIDSNLFLTKGYAIKLSPSNLIAESNIFGTLDTTNKQNYVKSNYGIYKPWHLYSENNRFIDNYFIGFQEAAIYSAGSGETTIEKNKFYYNKVDINISIDNGFIDPMGIYNIKNNSAEDGGTFLNANNVFELYLENNDIRNYDTIYYNRNHGGVQKDDTRIIKHINNKMCCIKKQLINLNPHTIPWHSIPVVKSVNRDQITGIGNPYDSVVVYSNNRNNCPDAICEGGIELGRTQADGSGNWALNVVYPNKSSISAFQFDSDPSKRRTMYSEFSSCYQCPGIVKINHSQFICPGQSTSFRGKIYSDLNPIDTFIIKGDDVSICDSMFLVNLFIYPESRSQLDVQICSNDTLKFGSVLIHQGHLSDSLILQSTSGCDSTVVINAVLTGFGQLNRIICVDESLKIGGTVFNKDHLSGRAIIQGGSITGCDSIVDVKLSIDYTKSIELPNDTTIHKGNQLVINTNINFIPSSIKWSPNLYLDCDTCLSPLSKPDDNITYLFTATDENGCTVTDHFTISILFDKAEIFVPTAFSPNGDNINDIFSPVFKFPNSTAIKIFRIFDRWGNQIYERLNGAIGESFGWDGTSKGEKMNPGVYVFTIQFVGDDKLSKWKTGDITLMR